MASYTPYHAKYFAHFLTREGLGENEGLSQSLSSARVDLNPHQVHAAKHGDKPWRYALIPHDRVLPNSTLDGLLSQFTRPTDMELLGRYVLDQQTY